MGCGGSKVDDLPLVTLCRERRDLVRAASDHRYALAAAHVSYFHSLKDVGDALRRFVDEELIVGVSSPSDSPVLTLPSDDGKTKKNRKKSDHSAVNKSSSSSTSVTHSASLSHNHSPEDKENEDSHLHLSSDSELGSSSSGHIHIEDSSEAEEVPSSSYSPSKAWSPPGVHSYSYYMKRSSTAIPSVVYEEPQPSTSQWGEAADPYSSYPHYGSGAYFGLPMGSPSRDAYRNQQSSSPAKPPAPPSPNVSAWDFLNPFDSYDNGYAGYYSHSRYAYGSISSSPDSKEVREREGIPELEEETEQEILKEVHKEKKVNSGVTNKNSGEGTSRAVPSQSIDEPVKQDFESSGEKNEEIKSSTPDSVVSRSIEEESVRKKGVSFEVDEVSTQDVESSKPSSLTPLSAHGTRDLQEVVKEIRDEFETISGYGKEVAVMLEVGKLPYQPRVTILKVIFSRILYCIAPSMSASHPSSGRSVQLSSSTMKIPKPYNSDPGMVINVKPCNLSSTLEKLYAWEKKLYKEVKDEERLRIIYEKKCKRLKVLDDRGADSGKIDATQASIRKLLTRLDVCMGTIDAISSRIHKLRDEELQPQVIELINGLIRMWKLMLRCHQKQFQAIMESKIRTLRANTGFRGDSSLRATLELEMVLLKWCTRFNDWIDAQKSYVESLNGWLLRCLLQEPEETPDGIAPFSPSKAGAPPVFIICNDWYQAMERVSEFDVANVMHDFAKSLHLLWEKQDEEQRRRLKAEYLSKDFEKQLRNLRMERGRLEHSPVAFPDKTAGSVVPSDSGVSRLDDLKVDLDLMKQKLEEERVRHKEAVKLVHNAASTSIQAGLIPIFEALSNFTSEALKAYEHVRIQTAVEGS